MNPRKDLEEAYLVLRAHRGPLDWWPGRTRFEIIVGALLAQNTAWTNVVKAIAALRSARLLSVSALRRIPATELAEVIRPAGYFRQKARKLKAFLSFIDEHYCGRLALLGRTDTPELRAQLLSVWGIGPETADSILLYAFERPVFVVDTYTRRLALRHGWIASPASYGDLQALFMAHLPADVALYNDYHAQIVEVGKRYCRKIPRCENCPLAGLRTTGSLE